MTLSASAANQTFERRQTAICLLGSVPGDHRIDAGRSIEVNPASSVMAGPNIEYSYVACQAHFARMHKIPLSECGLGHITRVMEGAHLSGTGTRHGRRQARKLVVVGKEVHRQGGRVPSAQVAALTGHRFCRAALHLLSVSRRDAA